ncbi:MAG: hypothetical protein D3906_02565 [Candidatus Electrothrix sp. AUS1_2]|nr:hypothetical protein [Candidatus Electrothrix sp. AUS1_2]
MIWISLVVIAILTMVAVSLIFASSTYSPMPGIPDDHKVLRKNELLTPEHDTQATAEFQNIHEDVKKIVPSANASYYEQCDLQAASQALLQAVKSYEAIRNQA